MYDKLVCRGEKNNKTTQTIKQKTPTKKIPNHQNKKGMNYTWNSVDLQKT